MTVTESESSLSQGEKAPGFELESYTGEKVSLSDLDNYDGVLVVFMCNHCPYVKAQVEELRKLTGEFSSVAVVGINPNPETKPEDSVENMEEFVEENDLESSNFYYLADPEQEVARAYDARCTPDPFLLDWRHRLYYHGRLNDRMNPDEEVKEREMKQVIEGMLKRRDPPGEQKPSQGCSIKWKEKG
ncbi:MAG: thioredoxin family protein [Candidatus Nanohaloarchaea archaeon]